MASDAMSNVRNRGAATDRETSASRVATRLTGWSGSTSQTALRAAGATREGSAAVLRTKVRLGALCCEAAR